MTEGAALPGIQRAAILLLALGEEQSSRLLGMMEEAEVKEIAAAMANLGAVKSEMIEHLCAEFTDRLGAGADLIGTFGSTERILLKALPRERVSQIMEEIRGPAGRTLWDKLGNVREEVLASFLKNEYPQTVAVVLARIRAEHAARVLALLPEGFAIEVAMRMLRSESVPRHVLEDVETTLRSEFMSNLARSTQRDPHAMMAEIFNNLDRQSEARFVAALEERSREAAERVKALMFTFDDLQRLAPAAIQALMRAIPRERLPVALKGATESLRSLFFANLSERAGKMLREEMEALGPVKLRDVDDAQAAIVATAKELAAQGQIQLAESRDDELVY